MIRYYVGLQRALYSLRDEDGFEFTNPHPLTVGWTPGGNQGPTIEQGAEALQQFIDAFSTLGLMPLRSEGLLDQGSRKAHDAGDPVDLRPGVLEDRAAPCGVNPQSGAGQDAQRSLVHLCPLVFSENL